MLLTSTEKLYSLDANKEQFFVQMYICSKMCKFQQSCRQDYCPFHHTAAQKSIYKKSDINTLAGCAVLFSRKS